eukprot:CAMPEP_0182441116 /NCGR_PEP_ID=MMETSP1172-20130603/61_1 /TAXON_ID=708627 /ORGANISM="Timspurckia oligopyrenoides, Strain CCMP3278" /LENGTH=724 /DNA_ID=CAMNT_0024635265 /DNA_START=84 /DNA_END=2258 /DNA_ORIENTATION=-
MEVAFISTYVGNHFGLSRSLTDSKYNALSITSTERRPSRCRGMIRMTASSNNTSGAFWKQPLYNNTNDNDSDQQHQQQQETESNSNSFLNSLAETFRSAFYNIDQHEFQQQIPNRYRPFRIDTENQQHPKSSCKQCFNEQLNRTAAQFVIADTRQASPDAELIEIVLKTSNTENQLLIASQQKVLRSHTKPGQYVQVAKDGDAFTCVVASAPGNAANEMHLLVDTKDAATPRFLRLAKKGDRLGVSVAIGDGFDANELSDASNLILLADCIHGMATVKSVLDWEDFKVRAGQGVLRSTKIHVLYEAKSHQNVAYAHRAKDWMIYGVTLRCVAKSDAGGTSKNGEIGRVLRSNAGSRSTDVAMMLVGETEVSMQRKSSSVYDILRKNTRAVVFCKEEKDRVDIKEALMMQCVPSMRIQTCSEEWIQSDVSSWMADGEEQDELELDDEEQRLRDLEEAVWNHWCEIRQSMRNEFEKKWARSSPSWSETYQENMKQQAWKSWFACNSERWTTFQWEDAWEKTWRSWNNQSSRSNASRSSSFDAGFYWNTNNSSSKRGANSNSWYQNSGSKSYWDWVRGPQSGAADDTHDSYSNSNSKYYESTGGYWGSSSTNRNSYSQQKGYKYEYDPSSSSEYQGGQKQSSGYKSSTRSSGFSSETDFYSMLGVNRSSDLKSIKKAYRQAARKYHPDLHRNDPNSDEKMKMVILAYTVLKDAKRRRNYDAFGAAGI